MTGLMIHLSEHARRALAASMIRQTTDGEVDALAAITLADVLDGVCAAVLRSAGLEDDEARAVLAALWSRP